MLSVVLVLVVIGVVLTTLKLTPKSNTPIAKDVKEVQKDADVIIVGGGVVGATLASALGKQGKKVLVFERNLGEPNRIVGELMQPGGVEHMHTLGLEECFEGIDAPTVTGYAVFNGDQSVVLDYPKTNGKIPVGRSFHHGRFIQNLRKACKNTPNVEIVEATVSKLVETQNRVTGVTYKQNDTVSEAYAPLVIVADGLFSKFRDELVGTKPIVNSSFVGFVVPNMKLPHGARGHVFLTDSAPTLCYPISSSEVRFLVDIPNPIPSNQDGSLAKYLLENVAAKLPSPVREAVANEIQSETCNIRSMPCSRLHGKAPTKKGTVLLGDAWNVRHPITGGGMSVALSDVVLLSEVLSKFDTLDDVQEIDEALRKEFFAKRVSRVAATNILAEAIYQVFAGRAEMKAMQQAIYSYFTFGPTFTNVPVGLLGALVTNPWSLITHFFVVAAYASVKMIVTTPLRIISSIKVIYTAASFFIPLLFLERVFRNPLSRK